ncbi:MAG: MOSC domain-containing protein [Bacteroidetes bacterium]|nr:MOSC domain-containing protein [Bacteroidota bacterium]
MITPLSISGLYLYPIKSCRGLAVQEAQALPQGFDRDRRWMLVDDNGRFLSQRETPLMCRIQPHLNHHGFSVGYLHESIPRLHIAADSSQGEKVQVSVWDDTLTAYRVSDQADAWFSQVLQRSCHLVWLGPDSHRPVDPRYAQADDETSFSDGYPYLIAGQETLDDLNQRLALAGESPVPMERFRPNIVLSGLAPGAEDQARKLQCGALTFDLVKPCTRCVVTTLDTATGQYGTEPLRTLASYRRGEKGVLFGMNALVRGAGLLRVGDEVRVKESI